MRCVAVHTEYIVQVSENKMSCKTFGSKKDKVNGQVKTVHNKVTFMKQQWERQGICVEIWWGKLSESST
jgi:hypothetical protein